jgi:Sulfotransferase domain
LITVVSGLPRSGTSLMMQMLAAGGVPIVTDGERQADEDNPRGYLEWEKVKKLPKDPEVIGEAEGKAVKVISWLLFSLPATHRYRVIFMRRALEEVLASQTEMLRRKGAAPGQVDDEALGNAFGVHLAQVEEWLEHRPDIAVCRVDYAELVREPARVAETVQKFLDLPLDTVAMVRQVDTSLHRHRAPS